MAKYRGRKVRLNKPTRIRKGQPSFGKKKFQVFVNDGGKTNKQCRPQTSQDTPTTHTYQTNRQPYRRQKLYCNPETICIQKNFDHHAQKPYEPTLLLSMMIKSS